MVHPLSASARIAGREARLLWRRLRHARLRRGRTFPLGMFTVVKVRPGLAAGDYRDPGPYRNPLGTVAYATGSSAGSRWVDRSPSGGRYLMARRLAIMFVPAPTLR